MFFSVSIHDFAFTTRRLNLWTAMTLYNLTEDVRIFSVHICMITFCAWTDCVMTSLGMNWLRDYIMGMNCLRDYIMGMNWLHHGYELIVWLHSALELIVWLHHWHALIHNPIENRIKIELNAYFVKTVLFD
jgi:hypothetical protein